MRQNRINKLYNIPAFLEYINVSGSKSSDLHITKLDEQSSLLLKSKPIQIDFYLISIKTTFTKKQGAELLNEEISDAFLFLDSPNNSLEWEFTPPISGYTMLIDANLLNKHAKDYSFLHYHMHEALFLTKSEEATLI